MFMTTSRGVWLAQSNHRIEERKSSVRTVKDDLGSTAEHWSHDSKMFGPQDFRLVQASSFSRFMPVQRVGATRRVTCCTLQ
jgi:hypothetical protein